MGLIGSWKNNGEKIRKHEKNSSSRKFTETDGQNGFAIPSSIRESKKTCFSQFKKNIFSFMAFSCVSLNSKAFQKHHSRQRQKSPGDKEFAKTKNSLQNSSLKRYSLNPSQEFSQRLFLPSDKGGVFTSHPQTQNLIKNLSNSNTFLFYIAKKDILEKQLKTGVRHDA